MALDANNFADINEPSSLAEDIAAELRDSQFTPTAAQVQEILDKVETVGGFDLSSYEEDDDDEDDDDEDDNVDEGDRAPFGGDDDDDEE